VHQVTQSLAGAPQQPGFRPVITLKTGRRCPQWEEIHDGSEPEYYHAMALTSGGTLVRARITPPEEGRKLYVQSVAGADAASDFSQWNYVNRYNVVTVAVTVMAEEAHLFYILADRRIEHLLSYDGGLNWIGPELIDYAPTTHINGIAAAFSSGGDIALFFADQNALYSKKCIKGVWQACADWPHAVGVLSGVAVAYDEDWTLMVTGRDLSGGYRLWHLVYGDGSRCLPGEWSGLTELAGAPDGENFTFEHASLSYAGVYRCFYNEIYSGTGSYCRSRVSVSVTDSLWAEPESFAGKGLYGFAQAAGSGYLWVGSSCRLYRARLDEPLLDLSRDVTGLFLKTGLQSTWLRLELDNSRYGYSDGATALEPGDLIYISLGYVTPLGPETAPALRFDLKSRQIHAGGGICRLIVEAGGGWERLASWQARHQYRWNRTPGETSAVKILAFLLARAGIEVESGSASTAANTLTPDFTLNPGSRGDQSVMRLLEMLPDRLVFEGLNGKIYNPEDTGEPCYAYSCSGGSGYPVYESGWQENITVFNHIQVEGEDLATGELILGTAFDRHSIEASGERMLAETGSPAGSPEKASGRARELLTGQLLRASGGYLRTPVNPAGQAGDVVAVECPAIAMTGDRCRIVAIETEYESRHGRYEQLIELETVPG